MKVSIVFVCFFALVSVFGCKQKDDFVSKVTLEFEERIVLPIDSVTKRGSKFIGFSQELGLVYLYNDFNRTVYFYDIERKEEAFKVYVDDKYFSQLAEVSEVFVKSRDSIFLFNRFSNKLFHLDSRGQIVEDYQIFRDKTDPYFQTLSSSLHIERGQVYFPIVPLKSTLEEKRKSVFRYSLGSGESDVFGDWPQGFMRYGRKGLTSYFVVNKDKGLCVISYAFDPYVYVYNKYSGGSQKFLASSKLINVASKKMNEQNFEEIMQYQLSNSWFGKVLYDADHEVYVRGVTLGRDIEGIRNLEELRKKLNKSNEVGAMAIIMDENFEKIGEVPNVYIKNASFVFSGRFYFVDNSYMRENEDILVFKRYKLKNL